MAVANTAKMYLGDTLISGGIETPVHTWNQIPELVKEYLENVTYDSSDYTVSSIADYAPETADVNNTYPTGITIETSAGVLDRQGYEVSVSDGNTTLYNDIPNQYTEYVVRNNDVISQVGIIKPTGTLRQIKCVTENVRDLGGWACDGGTVKYGKLFRGGEIFGTDIDIFVNQLGIRHELNLRGLSESGGKTQSILGSEIGYTCTDEYTWYSLSNETDWKTTLRCVFDAVATNKPLYFHCAAGADRTATVACIIEAILGVSQSDIDKDYELTCFAYGVDTDNNARRRNETDWTNLITEITSLSVGTTFRDKVLNWVASLGFTADEINTFRTAMIDGTPDTITLDIDTYSVTNTLSNVSTSNDAVDATQYQPYEANITVPNGYVIESIAVTMGGEEITSSVFNGVKTNLNRAVTVNLAKCSIDNQKKTVIDGQGYGATITPNKHYTLENATVIITMGGIDVSTFYSGGKIAIPEVTGDIVITATAVASALNYTNLAEPTSDDFLFGYRVNSSNEIVELENGVISNYIDLEGVTDLHVYGLYTGIGNLVLVFYDADKNLHTRNAFSDSGNTDGRFWEVADYNENVLIWHITNIRNYFSTLQDSGETFVRVQGTLTADSIDEVIITADEEITI